MYLWGVQDDEPCRSSSSHDMLLIMISRNSPWNMTHLLHSSANQTINFDDAQWPQQGWQQQQRTADLIMALPSNVAACRAAGHAR
jgi:hypothetical protein